MSRAGAGALMDDKYTRTIEPFSMKPRVSHGDVAVRLEDGEIVPAVNVKLPPLYYRMPAELQAVDGRTRYAAYENVAQSWWETVPQALADYLLNPVFRGMRPVALPTGRSNGWVVVRGIGAPDEWSEVQQHAWAEFVAAIKSSMAQAEKDFHEEISRL